VVESRKADWQIMDVAAWLKDLGLEQYAKAFAENKVDATLLSELWLAAYPLHAALKKPNIRKQLQLSYPIQG
jgi:hypothetical protein